MANLHLVTGYAGQEHITSADQGSFNVAFFGSGQYVLQRGNNLSATVVSNNQIRIYDGDIYMQGRHIRLNEGNYVDLTIENGVQGQNRNDLIVARYTKNASTGIEECNLVVIKGTSTTGTATDPAYTSGDIINGNALINDMPLYRVQLDGLNVGYPEEMFIRRFEGSLPNALKLIFSGNALGMYEFDGSEPVEITLSASMLGAAPAGLSYGYYVCNSDEAVDTAIQNHISDSTFKDGDVRHISIYSNASDNALPYGWRYFVELCKSSANYGVITAKAYHSSGPRIMRRQWYDGTLGEWEWENPPMIPGVEYRTTKRCLGKPVYAKVVDLGALPNTQYKYVSTGISAIANIVSETVEITSSSGTKYMGIGASDIDIAYLASSGNYIIHTTSDETSYTAVVTLEYTKD